MRYRPTTEEELSLILEEGEGYTLEFKQTVNSDLPKELVAFANASGGRVLIGVDDNNTIVGCDTSNKTLSQIESMATSCDPPVAIHIEKLPQQELLVIHVPEGANRPHRCNKGFFLRNGANSQKMSTEDITAFIQAEGKIRFDQRLRLDLDWKDALDSKRLDHYLQLANISPKPDIANLLTNLGAGEYKDDQFYLNQTGVLFFAKEPTQRLFHVNVVCALFKGTSKAYILDRKDLTGSILENIEDALIFLKKHLQMRWEITEKSTRRKEILELPEVALREAIINSVCHRDYLEEGANVMVEIFDDRVEIYNPGGLPKGLQEKDFGRRSVCRNPNIASLLLRCDYIEKMGSGIERIHTALVEARCPGVKIHFNTMFSLEFPRPTFIPETDSADIITDRTPHDTPHDTPHVTPHVERLLTVLQGEMARGELMEALELKDRKNFSQEYLTPALHGGFIEMTIPDKPKSKLQKYRLTDKGRIHAAK
ncbi:Fic family protein [Desulfogranum japonicum]|uniref:Fic family protein n=1 Tax=Desulfogranum japonicum TaxID=231447 RepID=UPI00041F7FF1|nr:RNA-binding domain-containing protein [Desulfogranum japonicum]